MVRTSDTALKKQRKRKRKEKINLDTTLRVDTPSDSKLNDLYNRCKKVVWIIQYTYVPDEYSDVVSYYGTGFYLDGCIITTAHPLPPTDDCIIKARPLDEHGFNYTAHLGYKKKNWDVAILDIEGEFHGSIATFPDDCSLSKGKPVVHIHGAYEFKSNHEEHGDTGFFSLGRVAFECWDDMKLSYTNPNDNRTCKNYGRLFFDILPSCRVMGDVCNKRSTLDYDTSEDTDLDDDLDDADRDDADRDETSDDPLIYFQVCINSIAKDLHPHVPLIHIIGLSYCPKSSGGPVFDDEGQVVGMMVFSQNYKHAFAIHSSVLKEALKEKALLKKKKK